jgi:predicted outer membrane repeat protein
MPAQLPSSLRPLPAALFALSTLSAGSATAATFTVSNCADSGAGSLRQAVINANGAAGADTITFAVSCSPITLTSGQLTITDSVTITGPGAAALTVSGNNASRIFEINGSGITVGISGLTITGGNDGPGGGILITTASAINIDSVVVTGNTSSDDGGGIYHTNYGGLLTLTNSTISNNSAGADGGGVNLYSSAVIRNTTISGNTAQSAGGGLVAYLDNPGTTLLIENSTISGNTKTTASRAGGGMRISTDNPGNSVTIRDSTIVNNTSSTTGGGISAYQPYLNLTITNTVIAGNSAASGTPDLDRISASPQVLNVTYSLVQGGGGAINGANVGNIFGVPAGLGPLANNGGPTLTQLPLPGSPVINAGDPAFVPPPATDQRGQPRVQGGRIDIGSVEVGSFVVPTLSAWVLGLLAAAMAFLGARVTRRRTRA